MINQGIEIIDNTYIVSITDLSDTLTNRAKIKFKNNHELSIIIGKYTYGGERGLFEIAPIHKDTGMDGSLFDYTDRSDMVLGYCSVEKVHHYIKKIGLLE